jgi:hypothetical protein
MTKERLTELGLDEEIADVLISEIEAEKEAGIAAFEDEKSEIVSNYEDKIKSINVENAAEKALYNAGAKNIKAVRALLSLDNAEFDENNGILGLKEQIKKLKSASDTEFLFEKNSFKGVSVGEGSGRTAVNTSDMNYSELCAYLEENPNAEI